MKLAIVGSCSLAGNRTAADIIRAVLKEYNPTLVISGGAVGIDTMAENAANEAGISTSIHLPKMKGWEHGFKPRNLLIARECDRLVRICAKDSKTYGSGWTRDRAIDFGKPTEEYVIDGGYLVDKSWTLGKPQQNKLFNPENGQ